MQPLHLGSGDVERDHVQAQLREGVARPAGVRADVEKRLPRHEPNPLEQQLELPGLAAPVGLVLVGEAQDPLAVPAVRPHQVGEALEPFRLARDDLGRVRHQLHHPPLDGRLVAARAAAE